MVHQTPSNAWCQFIVNVDFTKVVLRGSWRLSNLETIAASVSFPDLSGVSKVVLDGEALEEVDTAGAMLLYRMLNASGAQLEAVETVHFDEKQLNIGLLVKERLDRFDHFQSRGDLNLVERIGRATIEVYQKTKAFLAFLGETNSEVVRAAIHPRRIRIKEFFIQLERAFVDAIPVILLVTFLIGVVIAYLFAIQIEKFGANIFIVDAVALAMCRELSPIIVAIIVAGRSGSAFTAHIGTMKLNEEIDAMITLGLSPMQVLVLPRLFALVVALPLLVFIGDVAGITGGMLIAELRLNITGATFLERLHEVLPLQSFIIGLVKAPVFAAFIAVIGCRMGLSVENNARSVGLNTTSTVVQSIVAVIILNAVFAIIFVELGI